MAITKSCNIKFLLSVPLSGPIWSTSPGFNISSCSPKSSVRTSSRLSVDFPPNTIHDIILIGKHLFQCHLYCHGAAVTSLTSSTKEMTQNVKMHSSNGCGDGAFFVGHTVWPLLLKATFSLSIHIASPFLLMFFPTALVASKI